MTSSFDDPREAEIAGAFLRDGYVIRPVDDPGGLDRIRAAICRAAARHLGTQPPANPEGFLNAIHERVTPDGLNALRLAVINAVNAEDWLRPAYFRLARQTLATVVGNELAMQRRINLSIQLPDDTSSLLPVHADVLSGDSPFEVVVWLPLVDCRDTKSMFLLDPESNARVQHEMSSLDGRRVEDLFETIEGDVDFLTISYGQVMVFSQNLLHGNRVNRELETRWSMNCRFKSVFSPYADKKLGEFFEPITLRPASRMGMEYTYPGGFDD